MRFEIEPSHLFIRSSDEIPVKACCGVFRLSTLMTHKPTIERPKQGTPEKQSNEPRSVQIPPSSRQSSVFTLLHHIPLHIRTSYAFLNFKISNMMKTELLILVLCIFSAIVVVNVEAQAQSNDISDQCIGCICYASTGCKKDTGCSESGVCGPLLISWPFWADGGKYVIKGTNPSDPNAYHQCAQDLYCAAETVRGYMAKYKKDCNGDGIIDCQDYARIHKRGPGACDDPSITDSKYYQQFSVCNAQIRPN